MVRIQKRREFVGTYRELQPRSISEDWGISAKAAKTKGKSKSNRPLNGSTIEVDSGISAATVVLFAACSCSSRSSINVNSRANISFSLLPRIPNCLQRQSLRDRRVQRFSLRRELFSISANSSARNSASSAWALSNSSWLESFFLLTQSPETDQQRSLLVTEKYLQSPCVTTRLQLRFFSRQRPQRPDTASTTHDAPVRQQPAQDRDMTLPLAATWEAKRRQRIVDSCLGMIRLEGSKILRDQKPWKGRVTLGRDR